MKVLLIVYDNASYIHWFPQGLAYISAALRAAGHDVCVYSQDAEHYPDAHLTAYLDEHHFDVVGLSVIGGYYQYRKLLGLSAAVNRSRQRPYFIIGGHGPAPEPAYFLGKTQADAVVIGEGEKTVVELMDAIGDPHRLRDVKGIAFRDGENVTINPRRDLIEDIESLAWPAYDLFPMQYYRLLRMPHTTPTDFVMPVLSGRGCNFECTFCYRMDKGFRPRDTESVVEEIRFLKRAYGITYVAFSDELLMSSEARTVEICEAFLKANLDVKWDCNGRLNYAKDGVLSTMKKAGCVFINYGIEAMDNQVLRNMRKGLTTDLIVRGIEATLQAGISPGFNIIFGNVGDTRETLAEGVKFLLKYDDGAQRRTIRPVTPYPGSPLYDEAIRRGLLKDVDEFYERKHTNSDLVSVNFTDMTDDEFHRALLDANTRLLTNYYHKQLAATLHDAENLYLRRNAAFRGFRQA